LSGTCLALVQRLAAAVGNSTHVLESVGGISARYVSSDAAAEQATDCFMAAVRGVSRVSKYQPSHAGQDPPVFLCGHDSTEVGCPEHKTLWELKVETTEQINARHTAAW